MTEALFRRCGQRKTYQHGTRACYQQGCRQLACKRAEANYRSTLRNHRLRGKQPLGVKVPAVSTWQRLRALIREGYSKAEIARRLGMHSRAELQSPRLQVHTDTVTVKTVLKVHRLYRILIVEGSDGPDVPVDGPC